MSFTPHQRLLFWTALLIPITAVGSMVPPALLPACLLGGTFAILVLGDLLVSLRQTQGIKVELPSVFRISLEKEARLPVLFHNPLGKPQTIRLGLALPREIEASQNEVLINLPPDTPSSQFFQECKAFRRGKYFVKNSHLEKNSFMKFWNIRQKLQTPCEIRVYPDLSKDQKKLASLFLDRGNFGIHTRRMIGQGREFEKLREYAPGDSYDMIHWKATARKSHPITKVFQIEKTQEVYVILDFSRLTHRSFPHQPLLDHFINSSLTLELITEKQGDLFGLLTFSSQVKNFVRAKSGKAHYDICRESLYLLQPDMVTPDFGEVCSFLRIRLRKRALLFFLTDLSDPLFTENIVKNIDLICRQHLIVLCSPKPKQTSPLFQSDPVRSESEIYDRLHGHLQWHHQLETRKKLQRHGVELLHLEEGKISVQLVMEYLTIKQRQLL